MQFKINLNGDSAQTLKDRYRAVHEAARALDEALAKSMPHGRNYQTADAGAYEKDREWWETLRKYVDIIEDEAGDAARRIHRQEKGDYGPD